MVNSVRICVTVALLTALCGVGATVVTSKASAAPYYCYFRVYKAEKNNEWSVKSRVRNRLCFRVATTTYYGWIERGSQNVGSTGGGGAPYFNEVFLGDCWTGVYLSNPYTAHLSATIKSVRGATKSGSWMAATAWIHCNVQGGGAPTLASLKAFSPVMRLLNPQRARYVVTDEYGTAEEFYIGDDDGT